ncbi:D-isomer specific 2-hydroxyacid dehydrogenase, NAD-binding [Penicillium italicum]|uniref:D-isomer specific 2-hydroxyacid dehydrogenase, NAD-binding n=1 Tax=Penicillium italicum TaxID=40296 RepID=A0A0A2KWY6_PENIT|nr:D-isomer specific 2-hydroxyacid dehydrogenase, NAD-binding [Penicillium italicum]
MTNPMVLHLGDGIHWYSDQYSKFKDAFQIRRFCSMSRLGFIRTLKERQLSDFVAIYRPFWNRGGEMRNLDENLVSLLLDSRKVYASASAGAGHTLRIVGFGQIGRRTAEKAFLALNMNIHYRDIVQMPARLEAVSKATYHKDMDSLLAVFDCAMVSTPFSGETLLHASQLARMKAADALKSGKLAAAGLDVHYIEPHVSPELACMKKVEMMAHNAGASSVDSHIGFEKLGNRVIENYHFALLLPSHAFYSTPTFLANRLKPTGMNGQAAAVPSGLAAAAAAPSITPLSIRQAFEVGIVNLRASIDQLDAMASSGNFDPAYFEDLSERILDTKIEFANQIRRWRNRQDAVILANLYGRLIGAMPDEDGVIP